MRLLLEAPQSCQQRDTVSAEPEHLEGHTEGSACLVALFLSGFPGAEALVHHLPPP